MRSIEQESPTQHDINSQEYWNKILAKQGLPSKLISTETGLNRAGYNNISLEESRRTEHDIKNAIADAIEYENIHSSATPINRSTGLPPCQMAKEQKERSFDSKSFTFEET